VVSRGCLRRLTRPDGMRLYLVQNGVLCQQYEDHVKKVSQDLKHASLEPFRHEVLRNRTCRGPSNRVMHSVWQGFGYGLRGLRNGPPLTAPGVSAILVLELNRGT
jgi:hypothetical protein